MDSKIFVLLIIAIVFGFGFLEKKRKSEIELEKEKNKSGGDDVKNEIADLKERVETLERIATDKGARLREEIDAL